DGERVGEHAGAAGYTVGQRQGLGVALGEPRYVSRVDPRSNTITLGRREDLETTTFEIDDVGFVDEAPPAGPGAAFRAAVRIRHRAAPVDATIRPIDGEQPRRGGRWLVETEAPVWAIAPGQAAVLYDGEACLGGGRIARGASGGIAAATSGRLPAATPPAGRDARVSVA
ncbi:MAG TPA: aminomethyltransferase beta-barrel domain-containing protein, partial [Candidatus Limnocylindrales bacterium]|nr:aminomethyltransferase beta-barrel domain-containing protein [Candidatus Limnocylindrales bacterium]